jgi:Domain of unknown function (DUF4345)
MSGGLAKTASVLQFVYSTALVVVGAVGIFTPHWEFPTLYGIDPSGWSHDSQANLLNQYRFLKAVELGAGLFCFANRPSILDGGRASLLFLSFVGLGVFARALAWIADGRPSALFIGFLLFEVLLFVVVALHLRTSDG